MRYHAAMDFDLHHGIHERRPAAECSIVPLVIAGILAGAAAAVGAGTAIGANAGTGNKARIKELKAAQATGRLTTGDAAMLAQAERAQQRAVDQASMDAANIAANQGATSGRDMANLAAAKMEAQQGAADKASAAFAQLYGQEAQESEDRKAIRRDRTMEVGNFFVKGLSDVAGAVGGYAGASGETSKTQPLDFGGDEDVEMMYWMMQNDPDSYAQLTQDQGSVSRGNYQGYSL